MGTFHTTVEIRSTDTDCTGLFDPRTKIRYVIKDGVRYPSELKRKGKMFGVLWETKNGQWVNKVIAIREGLELTGKKEKRFLGYTFDYSAIISRKVTK